MPASIWVFNFKIMENEKGKLKIDFKAPDGYKSQIIGSCSLETWFNINRAIEGKMLFTKEEILNFATTCMIRNNNKENGTILDWFEQYLTERTND